VDRVLSSCELKNCVHEDIEMEFVTSLTRSAPPCSVAGACLREAEDASTSRFKFYFTMQLGNA